MDDTSSIAIDPVSGETLYFDTQGNQVGSYDPSTGIFTPTGGGISNSNDQAVISAGSSSTVSTVSDLAKLVIGTISTYQLQQINLERARRGLSPLNTAAYGPQIGVGLNQQTSSLILWVAVGLGAVMLLSGKR